MNDLALPSPITSRYCAGCEILLSPAESNQPFCPQCAAWIEMGRAWESMIKAYRKIEKSEPDWSAA